MLTPPPSAIRYSMPEIPGLLDMHHDYLLEQSGR